jgi:hypothetical protein
MSLESARSDSFWGIACRFEDKQYFIYDDGFPMLFLTRDKAREYVKENYTDIEIQERLKQGTNGWKAPRVVKVRMELVWK